KKKEHIKAKDKEDLKALKELFETDLNIQLGDFNGTQIRKTWQDSVKSGQDRIQRME
ncbi:2271_t:CDS:1, partial [Gigaspora rosea]